MEIECACGIGRINIFSSHQTRFLPFLNFLSSTDTYLGGTETEIVMITYYIGQFLIAQSSMLDDRKSTKHLKQA